jgi:transcription initiation factor TFIIF subunit alpha
MSQIQKNKDPERWLLHRRNGMALSAATTATLRAEAGTGTPLVQDSGQSLGPGGRRLRTVDSGGDLFGDEEEDTKRRRRGGGAEGDIDEQIYDEDFADDEEKMEEDGEDEEAKELEVTGHFLAEFTPLQSLFLVLGTAQEGVQNRE